MVQSLTKNFVDIVLRFCAYKAALLKDIEKAFLHDSCTFKDVLDVQPVAIPRCYVLDTQEPDESYVSYELDRLCNAFIKA